MASVMNGYVSGASSSIDGLNNALNVQQHAIERSTEVSLSVLIFNHDTYNLDRILTLQSPS